MFGGRTTKIHKKSTRYCVILTIRPPVPLGLVYHGQWSFTFCHLLGAATHLLSSQLGVAAFRENAWDPSGGCVVSRHFHFSFLDFQVISAAAGLYLELLRISLKTGKTQVFKRLVSEPLPFLVGVYHLPKGTTLFLKWCLTSRDLEHERNQHPALKMNECRAGKGTISTGELSSYHHFLGDMSVFRGVKIGGLGRCLSFSFGGYFQVPAVDFPRMYRQCPPIFSPKKR